MSHVLKLLIFLISSQVAFLASGADAHENLKWKDKNVSVCWADEIILKEILSPFIEMSGTAGLEIPIVEKSSKKKIKQLINIHFSKEVTGIHFTGWETCVPMDKSVKLFYFQDLKFTSVSTYNFVSKFLSLLTGNYLGVASIGNGAFADLEMNTPGKNGSQAVILKTLNPGTILHEFGHLSGLRHEHTKADVLHGETCHQFKTIISDSFKFPSEEKNGAVTLTVADDFSIMNYCYFKLWRGLNIVKDFDITERLEIPYPEYMVKENGRFRYRTLLSVSDIHSLRCLYTDENEEHYCRHYNPSLDKFSLKVYRKYLDNIISNESQNTYEY